MNREHMKFRVWDSRGKQMIMPDTDEGNFLVIGLDGEITGTSYGELVDPEPESILLQATGVPDKNLKEIYEGDLISYRGRTGVVEFFAGMFVCSWNWGENDDQTETELGYMITADMEIVGHKYKTT